MTFLVALVWLVWGVLIGLGIVNNPSIWMVWQFNVLVFLLFVACCVFMHQYMRRSNSKKRGRRPRQELGLEDKK